MVRPYATRQFLDTHVESISKAVSAPARREDVSVRRVNRRPMSALVRLSVFRPDGSLYDRGRAILVDLSSAGAQIEDLDLPLGALLPLGFSLGISFGTGPVWEAGTRAEIVWFQDGKKRRYGIRFLNGSGSGR